MNYVMGTIQNERSAVNSDCKSCDPMINVSSFPIQMKTGKTGALPVFRFGPSICQDRSNILDVTKLQVRNVMYIIAAHATMPAARMEPDNSMAWPFSSTLRMDGTQ